MYKIIIDADLGEKLKRFPKSDQRKIYRYLRLLEQQLLPEGKNIKKLRGTKHTIWRIRLGQIRILYTIENPFIRIIDIDYRSRVYMR